MSEYIKFDKRPPDKKYGKKGAERIQKAVYELTITKRDTPPDQYQWLHIDDKPARIASIRGTLRRINKVETNWRCITESEKLADGLLRLYICRMENTQIDTLAYPDAYIKEMP